jgi:hypothetical protein
MRDTRPSAADYSHNKEEMTAVRLFGPYVGETRSLYTYILSKSPSSEFLIHVTVLPSSMATEKTSRWEEPRLAGYGGRRYIVVCGGESFD